ncbi:MAG: 50S ribosomal protein L11 methyltransferase [Sphingomonadaceae bacterium]
MSDSWLLTLGCTRAEAEAIGDAEIDGVVLTVSEPDPATPERWRLDAYFEGKPPRELLRRVAALVPSVRAKDSRAKPLPPQDWVSLSQAGVAPLVAGRFHVHTPDYPRRTDLIDFEIPAGLAFGTGQHATTAGCLEALDALKRQGKVTRDILDLGTGTGLLAFAAMRLWPAARATASDIDPVSIAVVRENAARNGIRRLHCVVADGLDHRDLITRAPYDLVIANILAAPLIEMSAHIAASVAPKGTLILAGLLDTQAEAVARAYRRQGMRLVSRGSGEWPVLVMRGR